MNARKIIETDLRNCIHTGFKAGIIVNPRIPGDFYSNPTRIGSKHNKYENEDDFLTKYIEDYERGDYFFSLADGACLQVFYEFEVNRRNSYLSKSSLIFLPSLQDGRITHEYLRFDFCDDKNDGHFFHACAHMHVGFRNTIRFPTNEVLLFSNFLKLVLYLFYPVDYKNFTGEVCSYSREKACGNLTHERILASELEGFMHLYMTID